MSLSPTPDGTPGSRHSSRGVWSGVNDGEPWRIEVEVDRMADTEPFTVSVWVRDEHGHLQVEVTKSTHHEGTLWVVDEAGCADEVRR